MMVKTLITLLMATSNMIMLMRHTLSLVMMNWAKPQEWTPMTPMTNQAKPQEWVPKMQVWMPKSQEWMAMMTMVDDKMLEQQMDQQYGLQSGCHHLRP